MTLHCTQTFGEASIDCYRNEIPSFIAEELVNLYQTLHSSLPFFETFRTLAHISCYVSRRSGCPSSIFLFVFRGRRIDVLNEMIEVTKQELEQFTRYIFVKFPQVDIISFKALKTSTSGFHYPVQKYGSKETYYIALPETPDEYTASIGKSTRASILSRNNQVRRTFPSFRSEFRTGSDIDETELQVIMKLSEAKINANGHRLTHDVEKITALAKKCGFVNVLMIEGRVCAGSINYQIGSNYFGEVIAYDSRYDKFGLGKLCAYQTIRESIARGGRRFYLGGGVFDFKQSLLGKPLSMDELTIYRSRRAMLLNPHNAAATVLAGHVRRWKKVLHEHQKNILARSVFNCFYFFKSRNVK